MNGKFPYVRFGRVALFCFVLCTSLPAPDVRYPELDARRDYKASGFAEARENGVTSVSVLSSDASRFSALSLNPFLAFDLGLVSDAGQVSPDLATHLSTWLVHAAPRDTPGAVQTDRLKRDGRAVYTGFVPVSSYPLRSATLRP